MKLVAVHRSPVIYLTAKETHGKPHLRDIQMKVVQPVNASNRVSSRQMRSVGSQSTTRRETDKRKGGKERIAEGYQEQVK